MEDDDVVAARPQRTDRLVSKTRWYQGPLGVAMLATAALLALWWRFYQDPDLAVVRRWRLRAGFSILLLLGFIALDWRIGRQEWDGEPFAVLEGISVWPSLYLRLAVFVISLYFIFASWNDMRSTDRDLFDRFKLSRALVTEQGRMVGLVTMRDMAIRYSAPAGEEG